MDFLDLKAFLDEKVDLYNKPSFIENDPIQIPHRFERKEDIEISGFLSATIAWGNRKSIINNASKMMTLMDNDPYNFVMNHKEKDLTSLESFVHRTFNGQDFKQFIRSLRHIYENHGGLETLISENADEEFLQTSISKLKVHFFEIAHPARTLKHVSDPLKNSAAKRINMFLRWMVRDDDRGVDFGIWKSLNSSQLSCPLDVHSGKIARSLKLLIRKQNDAKALRELDLSLRKLDNKDPVKYDYALFGLSAFEKF